MITILKSFLVFSTGLLLVYTLSNSSAVNRDLTAKELSFLDGVSDFYADPVGSNILDFDETEWDNGVPEDNSAIHNNDADEEKILRTRDKIQPVPLVLAKVDPVQDTKDSINPSLDQRVAEVPDKVIAPENELLSEPAENKQEETTTGPISLVPLNPSRIDHEGQEKPGIPARENKDPDSPRIASAAKPYPDIPAVNSPSNPNFAGLPFGPDKVDKILPTISPIEELIETPIAEPPKMNGPDNGWEPAGMPPRRSLSPSRSIGGRNPAEEEPEEIMPVAERYDPVDVMPSDLDNNEFDDLFDKDIQEPVLTKINPVPEPSTAMFFGLILILLAFYTCLRSFRPALFTKVK